MAGFDNDVMYCDNVDFRGVKPVEGQVTQDGELLIGSSVAPFLRPNKLTSNDGSVDFTYGHGTIDLSVGSVTPSIAFYASVSADILNVTGGAGGPVYTILFDSVNYDPLNCYDPLTGKFTVPSGGAGNYLFCPSVTLTGVDTTHDTLVCNIVINDTTSMGNLSIINPGAVQTQNQYAFNGSFMFLLNDGDTVKINLDVLGLTQTINVAGVVYPLVITSFAGKRLG